MIRMLKKACCAVLTITTVLTVSSFLAFAQDNKQTTIHIVHTNDMHGYYKSTSRGQIGFEALKEIISNEDADLVLDIGDTFHGQSFATVEQGKSIAELMDSVGFDAMTPGNHDWSYGAQRVKQLDSESSFAVLAANIVKDNGEDYFENPYLIKDVIADDGRPIRVGVVGVIDDEFYSFTASQNIEGLKFTEESQKASNVAKTLKEQEHCDIVLAITHQMDCENFVANISNIDAVLAGHEHILVDNTYYDKDGKAVKVVEANCYFQNVGVLSLTIDSNNNVTESTEKLYSSADTKNMADEAVVQKTAEIEARESVVLSEIVGNSSKSYAYSWEKIRTHEQEIGRIVTAAYLDYTGADVAMENAGGIRGGLPKGDITYSDVIGISPYGNVLVEKELTGSQIVELLEYSLELNRINDAVYDLQKEAEKKGEDPYQYSWPDNSGSALQFGGIKAEYDMTKPYGQRASNIKIGDSDIDYSKTYRVVANNFAAETAEYAALASAPLKKEYTTCEQVLKNYIAKGVFESVATKENIVPVAEIEVPTEPQTQTTEEATSASVPETTQTAPVATSAPSTNDESDNPKSNDNTAIQTSNTIFVAELIFILISGCVFAAFVWKRKYGEEDE